MTTQSKELAEAKALEVRNAIVGPLDADNRTARKAFTIWLSFHGMLVPFWDVASDDTEELGDPMMRCATHGWLNYNINLVEAARRYPKIQWTLRAAEWKKTALKLNTAWRGADANNRGIT